MQRILFLDNAIANDTYSAPDLWRPLLVYPFDVFRTAFGEWPRELSAYSHILTTGSSASVRDDMDWIKTEAELIESAVGQGKVILGSCFGHQIIARALFGMQSVRKRQIPEIGWPDIEIMVDDPLLGDAGRIVNTFVFHYDEVCSVPEKSATIIARSKACEVLGFKLLDKPVWGIQPHFEMGIVEGLDYLDKVSGEHIPARQSFFNSDHSLPKDNGRIAPLMKAFQETQAIM
jgi:GMP synthase-like glutamine amidotransferase